MGRKVLLSLVFLSIRQIAFSQKEGNIWYFGNKAGITFNTVPPTALTNGQLNTTEGCATISTSKGRLLFYTDGTTVWDSTHGVMQNGTSLKGNASSTQSAVIVPRPDSAHIYYIFTVAEQANTNGLQYSEVNMKMNSGRGAIVSTRKNIKLKTPMCEKITAVAHANGRDYWILALKYDSDSGFAYRITNAGVNMTPVGFRTGFQIAGNSLKTIGYLKISPDGKKVAYANYTLDSSAVGDFDPSTGKISNLWRFYSPAAYGVEFSAKAKFLYISEFTIKKVVQYDLSASTKAALISSRKVIDSNYTSSPSALQLGPDGKIYLSVASSTSLSVIHAPDSLRFACRPQKNYLSLASKTALLGLPTFIQSFFIKKTFNVTRNCLNDSAFFVISEMNGLDSVKWIFGDPGSGNNNTSRQMVGAWHVYNKTGYYDVSLIAYAKTVKDTTKLKIYIKDPKPRLGKDSSFCNAFSFNITPHKKYLTYAWSGGGGTASSIDVTQKGTYSVKVKDSAGCFSEDTIVIKNPLVKAAFKISDSVMCQGINLFSVKDTSKYKEDAWKKSTWRYSDGRNKVDTVDKKKFSDTGVFFIKLVLQSKENCKDSISKKVRVLPGAKIGFNINKPEQCFKGHSYNFSNTSTIPKGTISYSWSFGDDSSSIQKDISGKKYLKDSSYTVRLITTSDKNCRDTISKTVNVYPNTAVSFTPSKIAQCYKQNGTAFTNNSKIRTGSVSVYSWNFGDNSTSSKKDIDNKIFSTADSFKVSLLAISDKGCRDSIKKTVYIWANSNLGFNINKPAQCFTGHSFDFTNTSAISSGTISHYWQFGDDSTSNLKDVNGKTYLKDSSYTIRLITTSDKGCKDTVDKSVSVYPNSKAGFIPSKTFQCFNFHSVNFTNTSSIRTGSIVTNSWNFGDNTNSLQKDISNKKYNMPDSFRVSLLLISDKACRDSIAKTIHIYPNTQIDFQVNKDTQCFEWNSFDYSNKSTLSKGIMSYAWDLGDSQTDTARNISQKKYALFGNYNVKLITSTDKNCKDTMVRQITVHASPVAKFIIDKDRQCFRDHVFNFTNQTNINNGSIASYDWDMDNAQQKNSQHVSNYSYNTEDSFDVRLIALSDKGCYDTVSHMAVTYAQPLAKFQVPNDSQCWQKHYFTIINLSTMKYGQMNHSWDFGDGTLDNAYTPSTKSYANKSAQYTIRYKIVSDHGCSDSMKHKVNLLERPVSAFDINDSVQCFKGHLFSFVNKTTFSAMSTLSYDWDYGNGNTSVGITPQSATYPQAKYYPVMLVSFSSLTNCYDTLITLVLPAPHAVPGFMVDKDSQCLRFNRFNFSNRSTLAFGSMNYKWDFRDASSSTAKDPSKHYITSANSYNVKLVVTTNHNCSDSIEKPMVLIPHPKASFAINDTSQCLNQHRFDLVNKTTLSYGSYGSQWLFDDATNNGNKDVSGKQFNTPGIHVITLTVLSGHQCTDTLSKTVYLENPKNTKVQLVGKDSQCLRGNSFDFSAQSTDPKVSYTAYNWEFGDGKTATSHPSKHTYAKEGLMRILLETISANGCRDTGYFSVVVQPHPVSSFTGTSPCFPGAVEFTNTSVISKGSIANTYWEFDDATISAQLNPVKSFANPGYHRIRLISKSAFGCSDTLLKDSGAWVRKKPTALFNFTTLPTVEFELTSLQLANQSSADVVLNHWDFGNGFTSPDKEPIAEYRDSASKWITLVVTNDENCLDTFRLSTGKMITDFFFNVPDAFTPNGNGHNEVFRPVSSPYIHYYVMEIFNRWGEKIFSTNDITKGWDGTYKGENCEQGVYLCRIYVVPMKGKLQSRDLSVTLLR